MMHSYKYLRALTMGMICGVTITSVVACGQPTSSKNANQVATDVVRVMSKQYNASSQSVTLKTKRAAHQASGEDIVDIRSATGIPNYITAAYPKVKVTSVRIVDAANTETMTMQSPAQAQTDASGNWTGPGPGLNQLGSAVFRGNSALPPGVRFDRNVRLIAAPSASRGAKAAAVLRVARSKLGTPYIWGHNEDRGQYGFDCSNYVAYVYHHALGYVFSGASNVQNASVGWRQPVHNFQVGDLLIFENGAHVGIYAGNGRFIEEGGGLGKVGYLSLTPGNYYHNRVTSVRRMF